MPDDDDLGQLSGVLFVPGIEGAQTGDEALRVPAAVWMMRPDEVPAAAPEFLSLGFVRLRNGGHLLRVGP